MSQDQNVSPIVRFVFQRSSDHPLGRSFPSRFPVGFTEIVNPGHGSVQDGDVHSQSAPL